jgi:hypothetical protein
MSVNIEVDGFVFVAMNPQVAARLVAKRGRCFEYRAFYVDPGDVFVLRNDWNTTLVGTIQEINAYLSAEKQESK